jgi:hypothetical protein
MLGILVLVAGMAVPALGQSQPSATTGRGSGFGLEASAGMQGALSFYQLGVLFPKINDRLFINLSARLASSLTWATFVDYDSGDSVSFHPMVAAGVLSCGGMSPMLYDAVRVYGGTDLMLGYSFMPYDSAIYGVPNLIGDNLTFAVLGYFGLEFFTAPRLSVFVDAGGGFKSMFADDGNLYVIASAWLGSGFAFRMGVRFYP